MQCTTTYCHSRYILTKLGVADIQIPYFDGPRRFLVVGFLIMEQSLKKQTKINFEKCVFLLLIYKDKISQNFYSSSQLQPHALIEFIQRNSPSTDIKSLWPSWQSVGFPCGWSGFYSRSGHCLFPSFFLCYARISILTPKGKE